MPRTGESRSVADVYFATQAAAYEAEEAVFKRMLVILGADPEKTKTWPFDELTCDEADWDGVSVELKEARPGLTLTDDQLKEVWKLGFTVIRIDYSGPPAGPPNISGDWWRVKGYYPGNCPCGGERGRKHK